MRAVVWTLIVYTTLVALIAFVALLVGCSSDGIAQPQPFTNTYNRGCDELGVCCYRMTGYGQISCVATKVVIVVSPGQIHDESLSEERSRKESRESQRESQIGGEVSRRTLEARLLKQFNGGRTTP